jgi:hypothetical protein
MIVKSNTGTNNTGSITPLCARFDDIADIMFPKATIPIVPIIIMDIRANKSGKFTGKKTKNISIVNNSRQNITNRFARNFPRYIDDGDIGDSNKPSKVPSSTSRLYIIDKENIPVKKNAIHKIGDARFDNEKSIIENANLKDAIIIIDSMR